MSFSELLPSGPGKPPALTLREIVLCVLAEAYLTRRARGAFCADCLTLRRLCPDHREDSEFAGWCEAAYMRVAGIGSDGAMLTLIGGLAP